MRIRETNENFEEFVGPLCYFDAMLSGYLSDELDGLKICDKEIELISSLMKWKLGHTQQMKYPKYIYDTFECFCMHKTQIILHLFALEDMNEGLRDLILYGLERSKRSRMIGDKTNLFRKEILDIFENVNSLIFPFCQKYSFSMLGLLQLIESSEIQKVTIRFTYEEDNWFSRLSKSSEWMDDINAKYKEKNWKIKYETDLSERTCKYWVSIDKL